MCARRPTSAMPKSFLCCERAFCRSMVVMFCALKWSVLMSWYLLRGLVMWWSRHLMRCNGLCCVMSRDAMRCHGDELYYSSTTVYYKVLLQYYSVLQILLCTTPVLPCKLYYKVPLKCYSVLPCTAQSTTPVLPRTTKYFMIDPHHIWNVICNARSNNRQPPTSANTAPATQNESHDWSASHMKRHLQCAEQQASPSNFTKYCACHAKWMSWLIRIAYETAFTMRRATVNTLQPHQILRLPRKMNLMIDPHHIWNVMYNARSNRHHPATSPNTAPATQNESHDWSTSHMKRHLQCAEQQSTPSNLTKYRTCHAKWISWLIGITHETSFTLRGATVNSPQPHQILRLPRKMHVMMDPHHIWNVIYIAQSNSQHPPTSPSTAPATQNESHDGSASPMKRYLQCAEQPSTPSNLTKYCACHAKWPPNIGQKFAENKWNAISNARPIREWSDHDPRMIRPWTRQSATRRATEVTFHTHQEQILLKITTFPAPAIIPNFT